MKMMLRFLIPAGITAIMTVIAAITQKIRLSKRYVTVERYREREVSAARPLFLGR